MNNIVVRFGKVLNMKTLRELTNQNSPEGRPSGKWLVLGYFDTLEICVPEGGADGSWLNSMFTHNVELSKHLDGNFYYHPLHLIAPADSQIWTNDPDRPYLFVTLVQGRADSTPDGRLCSEVLKEVATAAMGKSGDDAPSDIECLFCQTMELSDLVILMRSSSLLRLTQYLHGLYLRSEIGDLSTFAAIDQQYAARVWQEDEALEKDKSLEEKIFAEVRYVVRDTDYMHRYLRSVTTPGYFITGIEDLHIVWPSITVRQLLRHVLKPVMDEETNRLFCSAFSECITQVGIPEVLTEGDVPETGTDGQPEEAPGESGREEFLSEMCWRLLCDFKDIRSNRNWEDSDQVWLKTAHNLYNVMSDMSRNWVLDGFCYLILGAAEMFCREIKQVPGQISISGLANIQRFVRGWGLLMEQATRTDGRFIQMPGFSPALCDIPARLLEFYLAFIQMCANLICAWNSEEDVAMLLVPKICRRMKVVSIFDAPIKKNNLLCVDIPLEMLYDPTKVLCELSHELSHFVGEKWRNREDRSYQIMAAVSYEITAALEMNAESTVKLVYQRFLERAQEQNRSYSRLLAEYLKGIAKSILKGDDVFNQIRQHYLDEKRGQWSLATLTLWEIRNASARQTLISEEGDLDQRIDIIIYLFRECYADLCMINLLRPERRIYLELARQEIEFMDKAGDEKRHWDSQYTMIVERWSVILGMEALWPADSESVEALFGREEGQADGESSWDLFLQDVKASLSVQNGKRKGYYHYPETIRYLRDYLELCQHTIAAALQESADDRGKHQRDEYAALLEALVAGKAGSYQQCERLIQEYRGTFRVAGMW